jgi:carboxyl-terminal processing protease
MLKRILTVAAGVLLGVLVSTGAIRLASFWRLWPDREVDKAVAAYREVLELVKDQYVEGDRARVPDLSAAALHGLVESLDPHSEYLEAEDYRALEEEMSAEFGGIGIQVEMKADKVVVIAPIAGTPGDRAGIRRGDEIVSIDGTALERPSMDDVVGRLRGEPGTEVRVVLRRPGAAQDIDLLLRRERIQMKSVTEVEVLDGDIGYLQLAQFTEKTGEEFVAGLNTLSDRGARGLILDLRNNPGGLLDAAVAVAEPFFRKGELIVYTEGRKASEREEYLAEADEEPVDVPVVVLINAGSASAAEIVAGALKDTRRAVILGERSFGKGSVQSILRLKDGAGMRLTTARYYTPGGQTIHEKGVEPDVEVVMTPEEDARIRLQRTRSDIRSPEEFKERFGFEPVEDRQLDSARRLVRARLLQIGRDAAGGGSR